MRNWNIVIKDHFNWRSKELGALSIHCPKFPRKNLNEKICTYFANLHRSYWIKDGWRWLTGGSVWEQQMSKLQNRVFLDIWFQHAIFVFQTSLYPITISSNLSSNTFPFPLLRPWPAQAVTSSRCFIEGCKFLSPTDTSLQIAPHGSILTTNCHTQTVSSEPLIIPRSIFNWLLVEE